MSVKLGNCGRCFEPTAAATVERISFGNSTYDLQLCDHHADLLRRDLYGWTRCGTIVDDRATRFTGREEEDLSRGTVVASYVHIPIARIHPDPEPEQPRPAAAPRPHIVPDGFEGWTFSEHALDRRGSRCVSRDEALWAAVAPDISRPGVTVGTITHIRGRVQVVLDPVQKHIITVIDRSVTQEQEQELQNAAS